MNESEFEQTLRPLQPSQPSPELCERIANDLQAAARAGAALPAAGTLPTRGANTSQQRRGWMWLIGGAVAAAAVIAAVMMQREQFEPSLAVPAVSQNNDHPSSEFVALNEE